MGQDLLLDTLNEKTLIFCVTSGRSGTRLLSSLLKESAGVIAEHEPTPRVNFVMRSFVNVPTAAASWLLTEKLPAIAQAAAGPIYAETSHLFCKGLIEPLLQIGLRPRFITLCRPANEVARSLYQLNVIPERTQSGRLVLLGPSDPGVLRLPDWQQYLDYQLCYWYAREIERRQAAYSALFAMHDLPHFKIQKDQLLNWSMFRDLAHWATDGKAADQTAHTAICRVNQNPRTRILDGQTDRPLPPNVAELERAVDDALSQQDGALTPISS